MEKVLVEINFKSITEEDIDFLYKVYREARIDEMGINLWPENEREDFFKSQFVMQHNSYMKGYVNPAFDIILLDNVKVGRLYVERTDYEIRIIDIALLKEYRSRGIGNLILKELIRESEEKKIPLTLHVEYYNFAKEWYEKLGFKQEGESGVYIFMKRVV